MFISWFTSLKLTFIFLIIATLLPSNNIYVSFFWSSIKEIGGNNSSLIHIINTMRLLPIIKFLIEWMNRPEKLLLIGVVSSQENLLMRNAIRETWKNLVDGHNTQLKFIIGKDICNIPLADRLSKYDCLSWNPNLELSKSSF
jgi:hypothetical protein